MGKGKKKDKKKEKKSGHTDSVPQSLVAQGMKVFEVDWDKVTMIEEIKLIFKTLNLSVIFYDEEVPEHLKELYEKGFLIQKTQLNLTKDDDEGERRESSD